jgi:hypothetical protein
MPNKYNVDTLLMGFCIKCHKEMEDFPNMSLLKDKSDVPGMCLITDICDSCTNLNKVRSRINQNA